MKRYWIFIIISVSIISCKSELEKEQLLIDFKVKTKSTKKLYQIKSFKEGDYWDVPRKIKVQQKIDTLQINFEVLESSSTEIKGYVDLKQDTIILKIGKGIGIKELVIHEYQYKILNLKKTKYKIKIENNLEMTNLQ